MTTFCATGSPSSSGCLLPVPPPGTYPLSPVGGWAPGPNYPASGITNGQYPPLYFYGNPVLDPVVGKPAINISWPTVFDCLKKLEIVLPDPATADLMSDLQWILNAVIDEFEGPVDRNGGGGTGRLFTPTLCTRCYDGNNYATLRIDDMVPNHPFSVTIYGNPIPNVALKTDRERLGYNTLCLTGCADPFFGYDLYGGRFPQGIQNIAVSGIFGYSAVLPHDIFEAVRCEVAYRALVEGVVSISGAGERVKLAGFEVDTAAGISIWKDSSPIAVFHTLYGRTVERYRDKSQWKWALLAGSMS